MLHTVLLHLLFTHVLQAVLQAPAERDDQSSRIMAVHPLLDFHQPEKIKQKYLKDFFLSSENSWTFAGGDAV